MKRILHPYRSRYKYWSHSKLARFVEKKSGMIPTPSSATLDEWEAWRELNTVNHPISFYIVDKLFNKVQNIVYYPHDVYRDLRAYYRNRFVDKTHITPTGVKPGEWGDLTGHLLDIMFIRFQTYIESEKGHIQWSSSPEEKKMTNCERALKYLDWEISLGEESPYQAASAKEQKELYLWWLSWKEREYHFVSLEEDKKASDLEDKMMHRLINIRRSLWT